MKKTVLAAAVILMATAACSSDKSSASADENASVNTPSTESFEASTNIRYYDLDTIQKYYTLCKEAEELSQKLANEYQQYEYSLAMQAQREQQQFSDKLNSGQFASESEAQAAYNTVQQNSNSYQQRVLNKQNDIAQQLAEKNKEMLDSLTNYLVVYNNEHHYDAILVKTPGELFNPNLNITDELVKGLNARYKGAKADKKAEKASTAPAAAAKK